MEKDTVELKKEKEEECWVSPRSCNTSEKSTDAGKVTTIHLNTRAGRRWLSLLPLTDYKADCWVGGKTAGQGQKGGQPGER